MWDFFQPNRECSNPLRNQTYHLCVFHCLSSFGAFTTYALNQLRPFQISQQLFVFYNHISSYIWNIINISTLSGLLIFLPYLILYTVSGMIFNCNFRSFYILIPVCSVSNTVFGLVCCKIIYTSWFNSVSSI